MVEQHLTLKLTPYESFNNDTLKKVLSAVDNVTPVYAYDESYLVH
jgi:hypothetical protein